MAVQIEWSCDSVSAWLTALLGQTSRRFVAASRQECAFTQVRREMRFSGR